MSGGEKDRTPADRASASTGVDRGQKAEEKGSRRRGGRRWLFILLFLPLSVALVLAAFVRFFVQIEAGPEHRVPLGILDSGDPSARVEAIPAAPGSLAGHNVLVVTLDTTRPDRLGYLGNREIRTPNLDRLARSGVSFSAAIATSPTTLPSHASIFTGLYPFHHGARVNGLFVLEEEQTTLAERMQAHDYDTAAFVSSFVLNQKFGLDQGFEVYDDHVHNLPGEFSFEERRADATTDRAIAWLERPRSRPFYLWVHYFDPHAAYAPPSPYAEQYAFSYDGEIAFVDEQLGRLLKAVERVGAGRTLTVVTADHGEAFGEHGESTHGHLVQEATMRIPLIFHAQGAIRGGLHIEERVSQVDIMPTILSLLGFDPQADPDGVDLTRRVPKDRSLLAETVEGRINFGWARRAAFYRGRYKYTSAPNPELYDLLRDPLERQNVFASRRAVADRMEIALAALLPEEDDALIPTAGLKAGQIRQLAALGYVVTAGDGARHGDVGPDPRDMLPMWNRMFFLIGGPDVVARLPLWQRILNRLSRDPLPADRDDVIHALESMAEEHPDFAPVYEKLRGFYREENRIEDAARAQRQLDRAVSGRQLD